MDGTDVACLVGRRRGVRSEEHTSELQSQSNLVCRLLLEKKNKNSHRGTITLMLTLLSIFMVYLTLPVMVRSPAPLGFSGHALAVARVQLPFLLLFMIGPI